MRGQYYFNWNLRSLSVCSCSFEDSRVPPLNLYYGISIAEDLHCLKAVDRNFVWNGGTTRTHSSLCSWAGVSEQIANNVLFWLSLLKTLARQCLWWIEGFTHLMTSSVLICIFWLHVECRTFWLELANSESREKICMRLSEAQTRKYKSEDHRLQYYRIKK